MAHVTITYMFRGGGTQDQVLSILPNARETVSVNQAVGFNKEVAAVINSSEPIMAERPMYYAYWPYSYQLLDRYEGGHNVVGSPFKYTDWYFAEGYTGRGFDEWLCILNDNFEPATVAVTYMYRGGGTHTDTVMVGPRSRETISVNEGAGMNKELSVKIHSSVDIVVERPMYFGYHGYGNNPKWNGGHIVMGTTTSSNSWYFAEGYTGSGFEEWLTIQNPNPGPVSVNITYMIRRGGIVHQNVYLTGHSRETIDVNSAVGPNKELSAMVQCSEPIIVERPMYFYYRDGIDGGDVKMGAFIPWEHWFFAEGYTGAGFDEWITLSNPGPEATDVTITYMFRGGGTQTQTLSIGPYSRETVEVNQIVGFNKEISASVDATKPIVVERPMYFKYTGAYAGGF